MNTPLPKPVPRVITTKLLNFFATPNRFSPSAAELASLVIIIFNPVYFLKIDGICIVGQLRFGGLIISSVKLFALGAPIPIPKSLKSIYLLMIFSISIYKNSKKSFEDSYSLVFMNYYTFLIN